MKLRSLVIFSLAVIVTLSANAYAVRSNVPGLLSAPVVFTDEGGNVLPNGSYGVTIRFKDVAGMTLYEEEQVANVVNGAAALSLGTGFTPGTSYSQSTGGLSLDIFQVEGDITVEIQVEGQTLTHTVAVLGSQPFSYVSEYAVNVAESAISSSSILNGTIVADDLDPDFLSDLQNAIAYDVANSQAITAANILMDDVSGLINTSSTTVQGAIADLDQAIETMRDVELTQAVEDLESTITTEYVKANGTLAMSGDLSLGGNDINSVGNLDASGNISVGGTVDGVDVSALKTTVDNLDGTYATDSALTTAINGLGATYATDTELSNTIGALDSTYATDTALNNAIGALDSTYATDTALNNAISGLASTYATIGSLGNYLPLSGGTMSGNINMASGATVDGVDVSALNETVQNLDTDIAESDIPITIRPVAFGYMESTNGCENMQFISGYNVTSITPYRDSVSVRLANPLTERGTLIMITDDVSDPSSQTDRDHRCIRGRGSYHMLGNSLSSFYIVSCSEASSCRSVTEKAVSFMVYFVPD